MEQFILKYTWFALNYLFKNLGLDLLRRDGYGGLKPTSAWSFWLRFVCTNVALIFVIIAIHCYILIVEITSEDFMAALKEQIYNSVTTTFAMLSNVFSFSGLSFIGIFKLRNLSKGREQPISFFSYQPIPIKADKYNFLIS